MKNKVQLTQRNKNSKPKLNCFTSASICVHRRFRPAFSLAEVMIAIGILGIGMLMVAATFPVGLDQSRIVSEQTMAPIVANEAFTTLQLLLNDKSKNPKVRFRDTTTNDLSTDPLLTFKQALINTIGPNIPGTPTILFDTLILNPSEIRNINNWLGSPDSDSLYKPNDQLGDVTDTDGGNTRYYPSQPGGHIEPMYIWSTMFRRFDAGHVQFIVFVNRKSWQAPIILPLVDPTDPNNPVNGTNVNLSGFEYDGDPVDQERASIFSEGGYLVRNDGAIFIINSIDTTTYEYPNLILNRNASIDITSNPPEFQYFWFIPTDPNTGRSPCIGVYSRTFPLD